jgi:hypothetical protein
MAMNRFEMASRQQLEMLAAAYAIGCSHPDCERPSERPMHRALRGLAALLWLLSLVPELPELLCPICGEPATGPAGIAESVRAHLAARTGGATGVAYSLPISETPILHPCPDGAPACTMCWGRGWYQRGGYGPAIACVDCRPEALR